MFNRKTLYLTKKLKVLIVNSQLLPPELKYLCKESYLSWQSLGKATYKKYSLKYKNIIFKRSIYFIRDLPKGHVLTNKDIKRIRPGMGFTSKNYLIKLLEKKSSNLLREDNLLL